MLCTWLCTAIAASILLFYNFVDAIPLSVTDTVARQSRQARTGFTSPNVLALHRRRGSSISRLPLTGRDVNFDDGSYRWGMASLNWEDEERGLVTSITVDGQDFTVLVDTGSR
jgi:hypothetical protein